MKIKCGLGSKLRIIGLLLASIHLILFILVVNSMLKSKFDAQWQLSWMIFLPLDFPFSLIVLFSGKLFPAISFSFLPYPIGEFRGFILPLIVHGVLGTIWYAVIPSLLYKIFKIIKPNLARTP